MIDAYLAYNGFKQKFPELDAGQAHTALDQLLRNLLENTPGPTGSQKEKQDYHRMLFEPVEAWDDLAGISPTLLPIIVFRRIMVLDKMDIDPQLLSSWDNFSNRYLEILR